MNGCGVPKSRYCLGSCSSRRPTIDRLDALIPAIFITLHDTPPPDLLLNRNGSRLRCAIGALASDKLGRVVLAFV